MAMKKPTIAGARPKVNTTPSLQVKVSRAKEKAKVQRSAADVAAKNSRTMGSVASRTRDVTNQRALDAGRTATRGKIQLANSMKPKPAKKMTINVSKKINK